MKKVHVVISLPQTTKSPLQAHRGPAWCHATYFATTSTPLLQGLCRTVFWNNVPRYVYIVGSSRCTMCQTHLSVDRPQQRASTKQGTAKEQDRQDSGWDHQHHHRESQHESNMLQVLQVSCMDAKVKVSCQVMCHGCSVQCKTRLY